MHRNRMILFTLIMVVFLSMTWNSNASTRTAATCSYSDVSNAIIAASKGDTVLVPAGTCDWGASTLSVSKAISIIGAGSESTIISGTGILLSVNTGTSSGTFAFRISGFSWTTTGSNIAYITGAGSGWRIDHNRFNGTNYSKVNAVNIFANSSTWTLYGLIDSNAFNYSQLNVVGGTTAANNSWASNAQWGTGNAVFIENNTFLMDDSGSGVFHNSIDSNNGGRAIIRYNNFNDAYVMAHSACQTSVRGTRSFEIYNNTFNRSVSTTATSYLFLRAGSHVITGNVVSGGWSAYQTTKGAAVLDDRRSWWDPACTSGFGNSNGASPYDGNTPNPVNGNKVDGWPALDQIGRGAGAIGSQTSDPAYIWGNTSGKNCLNGTNKYQSCTTDSDCPGSKCSTQVNSPNSVVLGNNNNNQPYHIVSGRDYFSGQMKPSYTKYTCPHPLAGAGSCDPNKAGRDGYSIGGDGPKPPSLKIGN